MDQGVTVYCSGERPKGLRADTFITKSGRDYKVHSPAVVNGETGVFVIANLTPDTAMVTLPEAVVGLSVGPTEVRSHCIAVFSLVSGAGGAYTYSVVMKPAGAGLVTAQGNSDPVIIIDPPAN